MLQWLRHRQEARQLVQADAEALVSATTVPRPMVRLASASATRSRTTHAGRTRSAA